MKIFWQLSSYVFTGSYGLNYIQSTLMYIEGLGRWISVKRSSLIFRADNFFGDINVLELKSEKLFFMASLNEINFLEKWMWSRMLGKIFWVLDWGKEMNKSELSYL